MQDILKSHMKTPIRHAAGSVADVDTSLGHVLQSKASVEPVLKLGEVARYVLEADSVKRSGY